MNIALVRGLRFTCDEDADDGAGEGAFFPVDEDCRAVADLLEEVSEVLGFEGPEDYLIALVNEGRAFLRRFAALERRDAGETL